MATATETVSPADDEIRRDVLAQLKWDGRIQPSEIAVAVKDGSVTLNGWVDSDSKRWTAEEAVHRVRRVKAVVNEIEVRLPGSAERTDADIATAVVGALELDGVVPVEKLEVAVSNGWVTL
jgi:osmotically-inducible protein OsmY